ncbi:MAG: ATP-binding protein [Selenomonadaceae bacterium]|nr:ATP-binding protein [Selenomonadaceae bacterium]
MALKKLLSAIMSLVVVCVMTSVVFAASEIDSAELPEGVVPLTWQPSPQNLAIKTDEARKLYDKIRSGCYPTMEELKNSPVVAQLDALSKYYFTVYGNTADINTPERQELREKVLQEFLSIGSARKISDSSAKKASYVFDGPLKKDYKMTLVLGLPAVGKSTVYTNPHSAETGAFILDCDVVKTLLPEYKESYGGASDAVHFESFNIMDKAMESFLSGEMKGTNIILPIVATNLDELMSKYIKPFEAAGYDVQAVFIDAPENVSFARNIARQLDSGRVFRSAVAASFGQKPRELYDQLKDLKNSKGKNYGVGFFEFQEH